MGTWAIVGGVIFLMIGVFFMGYGAGVSLEHDDIGVRLIDMEKRIKSENLKQNLDILKVVEEIRDDNSMLRRKIDNTDEMLLKICDFNDTLIKSNEEQLKLILFTIGKIEEELDNKGVLIERIVRDLEAPNIGKVEKIDKEDAA